MINCNCAMDFGGGVGVAWALRGRFARVGLKHGRQ